MSETRQEIVIQRRDTSMPNVRWFDETTEYAETCDVDAVKEQVRLNNGPEKDALLPFEWRVVKRTITDEPL